MNHPLLQLILTRLREFYREPEALFWVYGFPLILAIGLGIAFCDRKPEPAPVDVVETPGAAELFDMLDQLKTKLKTEVHPPDECRQRLRTGKSALFVESTGDGYPLCLRPGPPGGTGRPERGRGGVFCAGRPASASKARTCPVAAARPMKP